MRRKKNPHDHIVNLVDEMLASRWHWMLREAQAGHHGVKLSAVSCGHGMKGAHQAAHYLVFTVLSSTRPSPAHDQEDSFASSNRQVIIHSPVRHVLVCAIKSANGSLVMF